MAVGNLATMLGDTITLLSQAYDCKQLSDDAYGGHDYVTVADLRPWAILRDDAWGHDYVTIASLWPWGNLATLSDDAWGHDYVPIASLWPWAT